MKFIEEYIRNLLGREAPPPVDADDLWASIAAGLPAENDPVAVLSVFGRRGIVGLALLLLLLGGAASWWLLPKEVYVQSVDAVSESPAGNLSPDPVSFAAAFGGPEERGDETGAETYSTQASGQAGESSYAPLTSEPSPASPGEVLVETGLSSTASPTNLGPAAAPSAAVSVPAAVNQNGSDKTLSTPLTEALSLPSNTGELLPMARAVTTPLSSAEWIENLPFDRSDPEVELLPQPFKTITNSRLSLGLHAGGNLQLQRFATSGEDAGNSLNKASGLATGQTFLLDLRYQINQQFAMSFGAEYHRTINTFRHAVERDTMVPHPTAPNTRLIEGIARRSVAHNNRGQILSIPVLLAYERRFGDFSLGMAAGFSANYQLSATGRSLDAAGGFIRYEEPVYDQFFFAYHLRPQFAWRPKPDSPWALELQTDLRYFNRGSSSIIGAAQNGWLIGGTIGVRRYL